MSQFTVIITNNIDKTNQNIKNNRYNQIKEKAPSYLATENNKILLKPPKAGELREYDADVVINETNYKNLIHMPAQQNAVKIQKAQ